jgi:hypothetical protein
MAVDDGSRKRGGTKGPSKGSEGDDDDGRGSAGDRGVRKNRPGGLKPRSIAKKRLTRAEMAAGKELLPYMDYRRPKTRGECKDFGRPCPFVSCRYHLFLDVNPLTGTLKLNFPGMDVWEMPFTCALDVADMGGRTLEEVGQILNMTRERVRQLESNALTKIRRFIDGLPPGEDEPSDPEAD